MGEEIATLVENDIWETIPCLGVVKAVTRRRVDEAERWLGGTVDYDNMQFEARSFSPWYRNDLDETFGLVGKKINSCTNANWYHS